MYGCLRLSFCVCVRIQSSADAVGLYFKSESARPFVNVHYISRIGCDCIYAIRKKNSLKAWMFLSGTAFFFSPSTEYVAACIYVCIFLLMLICGGSAWCCFDANTHPEDKNFKINNKNNTSALNIWYKQTTIPSHWPYLELRLMGLTSVLALSGRKNVSKILFIRWQSSNFCCRYRIGSAG